MMTSSEPWRRTCFTVIQRSKRMEPFLTRGVPNAELHVLPHPHTMQFNDYSNHNRVLPPQARHGMGVNTAHNGIATRTSCPRLTVLSRYDACTVLTRPSSYTPLTNRCTMEVFPTRPDPKQRKTGQYTKVATKIDEDDGHRAAASPPLPRKAVEHIK